MWTVAKNTWEKGLTYAYRDRKNKKRNFRALWIQRINAAARLEDLSYSKLMGLIHKAGIEINRKVLADLAVNNPAAFKAIDNRTEEQKAGLRQLLKELRQRYPDAKIMGHRDISPDKNHNGVVDPWERIKECPCFDAIPEYADI